MIEITCCPVCSGTQLSGFHSCEDHTVSHETFNISVCAGCGLGVTTPRPGDENIGSYYLSDEYISHSGNSSGVTGVLYKSARKITLGWKKKLVESYSSKGHILDYGCGTGEFLQHMQASGWEISGVEPSQVAREKAERITQKKVYETVDSLSQKKFNVITLWHVLEHIPNPNETLKQFKTLLAESGTVFIAVPNYKSPDAQHYKQHWAGYDVPRHLWHFSSDSMRKLLEANGFKIEAIKPMVLDAFYISLLSEKYKGSGLFKQYIGGFINGLRSNILAGKNTNFSSLIYIARST
ncbi:MAG: class I SAM-dependent methyltransferase [Cyclobacteriaceae bacterium]|nr:class I SAM-dependent methyltransferase [Cyclobacteriaceae bacterium]